MKFCSINLCEHILGNRVCRKSRAGRNGVLEKAAGEMWGYVGKSCETGNPLGGSDLREA